ncbi:basic membrane protein A [Thermanaeromonas toyohensis ToBE]|uniref:Basic membrane protein A n=1 Tax=Thermanaeromonas toyohensis ToBE TaxID=698762 RepID=A0A1W1VFU2_9FIRM|nr:BMP family protein [Thermanaeromonas toyohensis]SMB92083.1 basic membrane protein A [Thermanaeromonas toyohensis ToBE]
MKYISKILMIGLLGIFLLGCGTQGGGGAKTSKEEPKEKKFRVAMVLTGPINDAGWNESAYKGLMEAQKKFNIETAYTENVPQPDFESVIRDYADKGYNLIIAHGFEFTDAVKAVSPSFPKTIFAVVNGNSFQEPNMVSYRFNTPETGFLAGTVAGLVTKSNVVGMIGGMKFPHIVDSLKGFEAGAKYVNPKVKVLTGYTESWTDIPKGKEMAMAMIEQGADVVCANANQVGLGVIDAAKQKKIKAIGYIDDQYNVAPETVVVSAIQSVQDMMLHIIDQAMKGQAKPGLYLLGHKEGVIRLSSFHGHEKELPPSAMDKINEVLNGIKDGSLKAKGILPKSTFEK